MIKCPSCSMNLKYDVRSRAMKCDYCGGSFDPYLFEDVDRDAVMTEQSGQPGVKPKTDYFETAVWTCPGCGAELTYTDGTDVTSVCQYCGGANILFDRIKKQRRPEVIVPFKLTKDDCKTAYKKAARRAILSPGRLKRPSQIDSFRGIYMPYWEYTMSVGGKFSMDAKGRSHRTGDYIVTDVYRLSSDVSADFSGVSHDASRQFDDEISECLAPYHVADEVPFTPGFLSGFYAETDDDAEGVYKDVAKDVARDAVIKRAVESGFIESGHRPDVSSAAVPFKRTYSKRAMFPVWFMSYKKSRDRMTYATVNGSTGKVVADFPIGILRFLLCALIASAAIFALLFISGFSPRPHLVLVLTCLISSLCFYLNRKLFIREKGKGGRITKEEDHSFRKNESSAEDKAKGRSDKRKTALLVCLLFSPIFLGVIVQFGAGSFLMKMIDLICIAASIILLALSYGEHSRLKEKLPASQIFSGFLAFAAIISTILVLLNRPMNVYFYYFSIFNSFVFLVQFLFTVKEHNNRCYRRPPQFNKKGGDNGAE